MIYHYCSVNSFFNIIKNKSIRLTSYRFMNDSGEFSWAYNKFFEYALNKYKENPFYCTCNGLEGFAAYSIILQSLLLQKRHSLIACFSECRDTLSQWRGYAEDGQGLSIGFNKQKLFDFTDKVESAYEHIHKNSIIEFKKVDYAIDYDNIKILLEISNKTIQQICEIANKKAVPTSTPLQFYNLANFAIFIKNPAFQEEKEWRLAAHSFMALSQSNKKSEMDDELFYDNQWYWFDRLKNFAPNGIQYLVNNNLIKPYIDIPFNDMNEMMSEIFLGPKCKLSIDDVFNFCHSQGINLDRNKIKKSSATYI